MYKYLIFSIFGVCFAQVVPVRYNMSVATSEMNQTLLPNFVVHNADFTPGYTATFSISSLFKNDEIKTKLGYSCSDCFHPYASFIFENNVYYTDCDAPRKCRPEKSPCE